jgi:dipeptidyl aminopeptidase/acylaminoacyl peptidase
MLEISSRKLYLLTVDQVYSREALHGFQLSPDGQCLLFVHQYDNRVGEITEHGVQRIEVTPKANLCLLSCNTGYPQPLTDTGDFSAPATWSPDGKWLAFGQNDELHVMAADGGQRRWIRQERLYCPPATRPTVTGANGDACYGYPAWSPDGTSIVIAVRPHYQTVLRLVSADLKSQRDLYAAEGTIVGWDWSPDGRRIAFVTRNEDGWTGEIRVLDIDSAESRTLSAENHFPYQMPVATWASNHVIILRSNRSGWSKLWTLSIDGAGITPLTSGDWDDYAFRLSPDRRRVVYSSREGQSDSSDDLWLLPISGGEPMRLTHHPGVNVPLAWSESGEIFYWHSSPAERGDLWSIPSDGGSAKRITWSAPIALERKLRSPQEIVITGSDGARIPTLIYLPAYFREGDQYPAIVWIHGGPTMVARYDFSPYNSWLANLGYVVIVPNYRGSIGYGVAHMSAVSGDGLGKNDLSDVLSAGRYAKSLSYVDKSRGVGVGGRSWGGYLTLMAVTQAPEEFSCAVAGAAITDWFDQQAHTEVRYYDRWLVGGWVYEQPERAKARSPIDFVQRIRTPLFIFHGENDPSVPLPQFTAFVDQARCSGAVIEHITYPLEGHSNEKRENQQDTLSRTEAFFRRHLHAWNLRDNPCAGQVQ